MKSKGTGCDVTKVQHAIYVALRVAGWPESRDVLAADQKAPQPKIRVSPVAMQALRFDACSREMWAAARGQPFELGGRTMWFDGYRVVQDRRLEMYAVRADAP